jgi:hypothetical protein
MRHKLWFAYKKTMLTTVSYCNVQFKKMNFSFEEVFLRKRSSSFFVIFLYFLEN